ncbi:unnamed protein product, partial [Phaeothamnion confervicola]
FARLPGLRDNSVECPACGIWTAYASLSGHSRSELCKRKAAARVSPARAPVLSVPPPVFVFHAQVSQPAQPVQPIQPAQPVPRVRNPYFPNPDDGSGGVGGGSSSRASAPLPAPKPPTAGGRSQADASAACSGPTDVPALPPSPARRFSWTLSTASVAEPLDSVSIEGDLNVLVFETVCQVPAEWVESFCCAVCHVLLLLFDSVSPAAAPSPAAELPPIPSVPSSLPADFLPAGSGITLERAVKLLHLVAALLLGADGARSRRERFAQFAKGELGPLIADLLRFSRRQRPPAQAVPPGDAEVPMVQRAASFLRRHRGIGKAAQALTGTPMAPRTVGTALQLEAKHPHEDPELISAAAAEALARAEPPFRAQSFLEALKVADPTSSPGPDGLRYRFLQQATSEDVAGRSTLLGLLSRLASLCFEQPELLPASFFVLHASARLVAVGEKVRPIAMCGVLRRLMSSVFCRDNRGLFQELFEP